MPQPVTLEMAAEVVAAFVSNNPLPRGELPALIQAIHDTLTELSAGVEISTPKEEPKEPAVSIRKSVTAGYLICLEDGKQFKALKRHRTAWRFVGLRAVSKSWRKAELTYAGRDRTMKAASMSEKSLRERLVGAWTLSSFRRLFCERLCESSCSNGSDFHTLSFLCWAFR
jgi:ROS/MUCR transcriptional regulator protein